MMGYSKSSITKKLKQISNSKIKMAGKSKGIWTAKALKRRRDFGKWHSKRYIRRVLGLKKKSDPFEGASQAKAIVLSKIEIEAKQPNSAKRRCARVQLIKNSRQITAFMPRNNASKLIEEHDEVIVESIGGKMGRSKGVR